MAWLPWRRDFILRNSNEMSFRILDDRHEQVTGWAEHARFWLLLLGLALLLVFSVTLGVTSGPVPIPATRVWQIAWAQISGAGAGSWSQAEANIVWLIRFPRVLMAVF